MAVLGTLAALVCVVVGGTGLALFLDADEPGSAAAGFAFLLLGLAGAVALLGLSA